MAVQTWLALHQLSLPVLLSVPQQVQTVVVVGHVCLLLAPRRLGGALYAPLLGKCQGELDVIAIPVTAVKSHGSRVSKGSSLSIKTGLTRHPATFSGA